MKYVFIFIAMFFLNVQVYAQQVEIKTPCNEVVVNTGVQGAEYTPSVDVNGKSVVSADLRNNIRSIQYPIKIPVELSLLDFLDIEVPAGVAAGLDLDANVAVFEIFEDGRVEYNGQDISSSVSHSCDDAVETGIEVIEKSSEVVVEESPKADQKDGQSASDSVVSGDKVGEKSP